MPAFFNLLGGVNEQVHPKRIGAQELVQLAAAFESWKLAFGDDHQVYIAVCSRLTSGVGAKKDDAFSIGRFSKLRRDPLNFSLINHSSPS